MNRLRDIACYVCPPEIGVRDAIRRIDQTARLFQIVIDADGRLIGTLTDGDVRRAMLRDLPLSAPVRDAMNDSPVFGVLGEDERNRVKLESVRLIEPFLPIVDDRHVVREILFESAARNSSLHALVMAGGFGRRLGERTRSVPKPLLPIGGKPILEHVLGGLEDAGILDITVSLHHLAEQIECFLDGRSGRAAVATLLEERPLGTAGALGRLGELPPGTNVLVVNGDVLTKVDYAAMRAFHDRHGFDGTVAVTRHEVDIPFGVVRYGEDGSFDRIDEKPTLSQFVAAGVYILSPVFADMVVRNGPMDMNELLNLGRERGLDIGLFPIHEYWIDVGRPGDIDRAERDRMKPCR